MRYVDPSLWDDSYNYHTASVSLEVGLVVVACFILLSVGTFFLRHQKRRSFNYYYCCHRKSCWFSTNIIRPRSNSKSIFKEFNQVDTDVIQLQQAADVDAISRRFMMMMTIRRFLKKKKRDPFDSDYSRRIRNNVQENLSKTETEADSEADTETETETETEIKVKTPSSGFLGFPSIVVHSDVLDVNVKTRIDK